MGSKKFGSLSPPKFATAFQLNILGNMFRGSHSKFEEMARRLGGNIRVKCLSIYISEAHPKDGWSFGAQNGRWDINQQTTLEERRRDCRTWQSSFRGTT